MTTALPAALRFERRALTHPDAVRLIDEVQAEYVALYGGPDSAPIDDTEFAGDAGRFYVGYLGDEPVAMGAWRRLARAPSDQPEPCAEVKRMYVAAAYRRRGLARQVLALLERAAAAAGTRSLVLETGLRQPEAMRLYESCGYRPIPNYGHYRDSGLSRCFGKTLGPADTP